MASFTDASYEGLGGFSIAFNFKRCISSVNLVTLGWTALAVEPERYKSLPEGKLHSNVLEFLAVFVNTWLSIRILLIRDTPPSEWILKFLSDNTSALAWMARASRTRRPTIQNIACAYATILKFLALSIFTVITEHVLGVDNDNDDVLSRPSQFPTWSSASEVSPELNTLTVYCTVGLISYLHWLV